MRVVIRPKARGFEPVRVEVELQSVEELRQFTNAIREVSGHTPAFNALKGMLEDRMKEEGVR